MNLRKKQVELFSHTVEVGTGTGGLYIFHVYLNHEGKINHRIFGKFTVSQLNPNQIHDIRFYILNDTQFIDWFLYMSQRSSTYLPPQKRVFIADKVTQNSISKEVKANTKMYFIFDNRYSTFTTKEVTFQLFEEWEEEIDDKLDLVTTIPPQDKSLHDQVTKIIVESKTNLQIISPYIDMSLINELLTMKNKGITIQLITRTKNSFDGKAKKDAFSYLRSSLKGDHKTNDVIHSRIIISDHLKILVSSADLTHDSLRAQFNAGIMTTNNTIVKKLLEYFNNVWIKSGSQK